MKLRTKVVVYKIKIKLGGGDNDPKWRYQKVCFFIHCSYTIGVPESLWADQNPVTKIGPRPILILRF